MIIISRKARKLLKSLLDIRKSQESPRIKPEQYEKLIDEQGEPLGELVYHNLLIISVCLRIICLEFQTVQVSVRICVLHKRHWVFLQPPLKTFQKSQGKSATRQ